MLETLRAAMNWGMAQTPPLFKKSPFHRFGVRMNKKAETIRDRRLSREEEKRLLDTALQKMNTAEHQFVGALLHDRIIGALELCCRRGEMLLIQNKRVNWDTLPDRHPGRDGQGQGEPPHSVQPEGTARGDPQAPGDARARRVRVRQRRPARTSRTSRRPGRRCGCSRTASSREPGRKGAQWNREQLQRIDLRWHDLRHEGACRLLADGVDIRIIQLMLGHASIQQTQRYLNVTDEELRRGLEVSWNNKGRPLRLASGAEADRPLRGITSARALSPYLSHGTREARNVVAGAGFEPATFGL